MASPRERFEFASDNTAAICPPAWVSLAEANADAEISYGDDKWTRRVVGRVREVLDYPANDVLELDSGLFLPLVEACVRQVDLAAGRIVIAAGFADPE